MTGDGSLADEDRVYRGPRVFLVNRYFFPDESATAQIAGDLAFHLAQRGMRITAVASQSRYNDPAFLLPPHERVANVVIDRLATTQFGRAKLAGRALDYVSFYVSAFVYLLRNLQSDDIVICKTDPPMLSVVAGVAARMRGAKLVNWLQDVYPEIALRLGVARLPAIVVSALRAVRNRSLKVAAANIAIGQRMKTYLLSQGAPSDRIWVIPNWSRETADPIAAPDNPLRRAWGYGDGDLVVGYSGNLGRAHDFQIVIDAAAALADNSHIKFLMVGGGAAMEMIRLQARHLGLSNMQFQPYQPVEQLAESLSVPDIHWVSLKPELEGLILPSKVYGIAAVGRPFIFIGAADGELADLARDFAAGFVVDPQDGPGLVALLTSLALDRAMITTTGAHARAMLESFSAGKSLAIWDQVLGQVDRPGGSPNGTIHADKGS